MKIEPPYPDYPFFRNGFGKDIVRDCIDLSILAYSDLRSLEFQECSLKSMSNDQVSLVDKVLDWRSKGVQIRWLVEGDLQVLVAFAPHCPIIVAFRGTVNLVNWLRDFDCRLNSEGFHEGFWKAVGVFTPGLMAALEMTRENPYSDGPNPKEIIFTGHSLGAALAAAAAFRMVPCCNIKQAITFGQPRIGSSNAIENPKFQWTRYVHGDDMVVKVPLEKTHGFWYSTKYTHRGEQIDLARVPSPLLNREFPFWFPQKIRDHVPTLYAESIWR